MKPFDRNPKISPNPPVARRLRELELVTARLIRSGFAGDYHAAFHGQGIEFSQVREYQPGDDVRTIDWNVTARSGAPHVKQFVEERDLTILIAADVSASMGFGSLDRRKIDLASELIAVLAFAAEQNGDRVGLLLFESGVKRFIAPLRGRTHTQLVVREALVAGSALSGVVSWERFELFVRQIAKRRAVVIVLSDFLDDFLDKGFERPLRRLAVKHDLIAIGISDPREQHLPDRGIVRLIDAETGKRLIIDLKRRRKSEAATALEGRFKRLGVDFLPVSTAVPYERSLLRFFEQRVRRRA